MKQPELGRKVAEIRNSIGLTQDELSKKCKLSLRTIQRIESGLVNPRSYTLRIIGETLHFNFYPSEKKNKRLSFPKERINSILSQVIQLFNLKTNTMKKLSILSVAFSVIGFSLFMLFTSNKANGANEGKYSSTHQRGVTYLFPKGLKIQISNTKDTADFRFGDDVIQEYKYNIFLNGRYSGKVIQGDTVILDNGRITFNGSFSSFTSTNGQDIKYQIPGRLTISNVSLQDGKENIYLSNGQRITEDANKIYLNDLFIGEAFSDDLVILEGDKLKIIKRQNK